MSKLFSKILYVILIVLTIYSDSPLQGFLESFGESLLPSFSIIMFCILYPFDLLNKRDKIIRQFFQLVVYTIIITVISLFFYTILGNLSIRGEFLPIKSLKVLLYYIGYLSYMLLIYNCSLQLSIKELLRPFVWTFFLLTIILVIELFQIPDAFVWLHYSETPYYRVRLLTCESSWTAGLIQVFFSLSLYYSMYIEKSKLLMLLVIGFAVFHSVASDSKTLLGSLFIFVLIAGYLYMKGKKLSAKIGALSLGIVVMSALVYYILPKLSGSITTDIEEATSTVTRTYTMLCGFLIGTIFPFGTGFSAYMDLLPYMMKNNTWMMDIFFDTYNLSEVMGLATGTTGKALSSKSFIGQSTIYWGVLGTFYFLKIFIIRFNKTKKIIPQQGFWMLQCMFYIIILEICFTSGLMYEFLAFIMVIISMSNKGKKRLIKYRLR